VGRRARLDDSGVERRLRTRRDKDKTSLRKAAELLEGTYDPQADGLNVTREELLAGVKLNPNVLARQAEGADARR
jgi:hypothetical protein